MFDIGLSTNGNKDWAEFFRGCADAGIYYSELSPSQGRYGEVDFALVKRLADENGVGLWSFHLPFMPFEDYDISSLDEALRRRTADYCAELIKKAADIGINKYVIHPSAEPIAPEERKARMEASKQSLAELADIAAGCGGTICVEDLPRTCLGNCSADMLELLGADERLRACFDTNHLLFEDEAEFIGKVGDRIVTMHVSDRDASDERHWLPGEGVIDWAALYSALVSVGYDGVWMYELSLGTKPAAGRKRDLTYADLAENARTIFGGEKPYVV